MSDNETCNAQKSTSKTIRKQKTIVDLSAWESSEVGSTEASVLSGDGFPRITAVSSIRSSLFQKHALEQAATEKETKTESPEIYIFEKSREAGVLEAPFNFESSTSHEYCEYGKMNRKIWTKDILALVHNAIRFELVQLISILQSVQKRGIALTMRDFNGLREWWKICSQVVLDFLDLENKYLKPWFTAAFETGHTSSYSQKLLERMPELQKEIRDLVMSTSTSFTDLSEPQENDSADAQNIPRSKKALLIIHSLDALISHVCNYMEEQELCFPQTLTAMYKSEKSERDLIIRKIVKYAVKKSRTSDILLALLTRWMADPKAAKNFTKLMSETEDHCFDGLQAKYEINHGWFVDQFRVTAGL